MDVFKTFPEHPHPLAYPIVGAGIAVATSALGAAMQGDRFAPLQLGLAGAIGGAATGGLAGVLEAIAPSPDELAGIMRTIATISMASIAGAAIGSAMVQPLGFNLASPETAMAAGIYGTSAVLMGTAMTLMTGLVLGVLPERP